MVSRAVQLCFSCVDQHTADTFGRTVALDDVGSTLVVGAPREAGSVAGINGNARDNALAGAGAAYLFAKPNGTGALAQIAYVKASNPGAGDEFGGAVALSGDGSTLAVAAAGEASNANVINGNQLDNSAPRAGAVYIFTQNPPGGAWTQQAYIKASNAGANDQFGLALSLSFDGSTLAVGAPFEDSNGASQADNSLPDSGGAFLFFLFFFSSLTFCTGSGVRVRSHHELVANCLPQSQQCRRWRSLRRISGAER